MTFSLQGRAQDRLHAIESNAIDDAYAEIIKKMIQVALDERIALQDANVQEARASVESAFQAGLAFAREARQMARELCGIEEKNGP